MEWDESAIDFLLDRGFTPDLGARPLRRAVERHLLSPLALTIVCRQAPDSDQFLFISAKDDRLEIRFVDPAAEEAAPAPSSDAAEPGNGKLTPQSVLAHPQGSAEELGALRRHYEALCATVEDARWHELKQMALQEMNASDFWSSPGRFATLSLAEYIDRITAGLDRAGSLLRRLEQGARGARGAIPTDLLSLLAQNLHLLQAACADVSEGSPADAFLLVEARQDGTQDIAMARDFATRIAGMYEGWAEQRRMRLLRLDGSPGGKPNAADGGNGTFRRVYAVSGYGAHRFLAPESGLHVRERPSSRPRQFERDTVHVQVAAQPEGPSPGDEQQLARAAERALGEGGDNLSIVRRYREGPAPLVRDSANDRRSGRLDFVLQGNFDLL